jgi:predicted DNA-binding protein with PD1-like motif
MQSGEVVPHIHITLGKFGNESFTGHLVSGKIALFIELIINEIEEINMVRKEDKEIFGLHLLNFGD